MTTGGLRRRGPSEKEITMQRFILILFAILLVAGIVLAATGVLRFHSNADESTIILDKQELKQESRKALDKTGDALHKAAEKLRKSPDSAPAPPTKPADDSGNSRRTDEDTNSPKNDGRQL
jgi:hypothetical protein